MERKKRVKKRLIFYLFNVNLVMKPPPIPRLTLTKSSLFAVPFETMTDAVFSGLSFNISVL